MWKNVFYVLVFDHWPDVLSLFMDLIVHGGNQSLTAIPIAAFSYRQNNTKAQLTFSFNW
jgi:hypothetical protein